MFRQNINTNQQNKSALKEDAVKLRIRELESMLVDINVGIDKATKESGGNQKEQDKQASELRNAAGSLLKSISDQLQVQKQMLERIQKGEI